MATIYLETSVNLPADQLWQKVADVGGISNLLDIIMESSCEGDTRTCVTADGGKLKETILGIDHQNRRVAYTITESPFGLQFHAASMQVLDQGNGKSSLRWITDIKPDAAADMMGPIFKGELEKVAKKYG
ncbi:MAG: SRPBCC family protein [Deltaproteobacteria bacterium]|nr:SRPBCC family protein [Deltaproteobacteria bacterium]